MPQRRPIVLTLLLWTLAIVLALVSVGPALWLLAISLQRPGSDLHSIGGSPTMQNFAAAWKDGSLARPLLNSLLVTFVRASLNVVIAALAAYPLARMRFAARNTLFVLLLCTLMVPEQVVLVPMFRIVVGMGLYDTLAAVVLPFSVTAFGIFLCRQAFLAVPPSLEEAARLDGAGPLRIWWHVMLPLAAPTLATLALFSIIGAWSDLLWPLIVLQSRDSMTLPVAVNALMGTFSTNARAAYAGAVLSLIPIIVIFALLQRFMKPEMFGGAVKG
jgi:putative chitobiose transport system permease protein